MATRTISYSAKTKDATIDWLLQRKLKHIKQHSKGTILQGDGLKSPMGPIARVISVVPENNIIVIGNSKLSKEELNQFF